MFCRRFLSGLVMNVFTPALLFSKLGQSGKTLTLMATVHSQQLAALLLQLLTCDYSSLQSNRHSMT